MQSVHFANKPWFARVTTKLALAVVLGGFAVSAQGLSVPKTTPGILSEKIEHAEDKEAFIREVQDMLGVQLGLEGEISKSRIEALYNAAANTIARGNQARTDLHNLEVEQQSMPLRDACARVGTAEAERVVSEARRDRSQQREQDHIERIRSGDPQRAFTGPRSPRGERTRELSTRMHEIVSQNEQVQRFAREAGQAGDGDSITSLADEVVHEMAPGPWSAGSFLIRESIDDPAQQQQSEDFVELVAPMWLPDDRDLQGLDASRGNPEEKIALIRKANMQMIPNGILHGVMDTFVGDPATGLPSEMTLREQWVDEQYRDSDSFSRQVATGEIESIYEVRRGDAINTAYRLRDKLKGLQAGLREEKMLATWLAAKLDPAH